MELLNCPLASWPKQVGHGELSHFATWHIIPILFTFLCVLCISGREDYTCIGRMQHWLPLLSHLQHSTYPDTALRNVKGKKVPKYIVLGFACLSNLLDASFTEATLGSKLLKQKEDIHNCTQNILCVKGTKIVSVCLSFKSLVKSE